MVTNLCADIMGHNVTHHTQSYDDGEKNIAQFNANEGESHDIKFTKSRVDERMVMCGVYRFVYRMTKLGKIV